MLFMNNTEADVDERLANYISCFHALRTAWWWICRKYSHSLAIESGCTTWLYYATSHNTLVNDYIFADTWENGEFDSPLLQRMMHWRKLDLTVVP